MAALLLAAMVAVPAGAETEGERIRRLEAELAELRARVAELETGTPADAAELERRLDVLAGEIERLRAGEAVATATTSQYGLGPAASKVYRVDEGVSLGGYGEAIYERYDDEREDGADSNRRDRADFLRAIVYVGYKFNDEFVLNTEIEFEHASTGESGEASVEFAYLDWLWRPEMNLRAGLVLLPMGFINELHEPTTFLGVQRPLVERSVIPTTWRENGLGAWGELGGLAYRTYVVNGLDASGFSAAGLRGGRQKGSQALAEDLAWVGRLDWTPRPGVLVGGSLYHGGSGQDLRFEGETLDVGTTIAEAHAQLDWRGLRLRALAARAEVDDAAELSAALGLGSGSGVAEELRGGYLEAGYDVLAGSRRSLIPFVRWETVDTQAEVPAGFTADPARDQEVLTIGLSFKPIEQIVLKLDWQDVSTGAETGVDQLNLGLGYVF